MVGSLAEGQATSSRLVNVVAFFDPAGCMREWTKRERIRGGDKER